MAQLGSTNIYGDLTISKYVNIHKDYLKIDGTAVTATAAEINSLDGFTGDAADLNYAKSLYDTGVSSAEFDYLDGVTSNIQTQLNGKQASDADLTSIAALSGTSGFLKKTAANTWSLDTNTYLTGNQTITLSGDVSGSGTTSISVTVANDSHTHDTQYYTESEIDSTLSGYSTTSHNHTLDGLSNTTITSNSSGEILKWNGSAWVNNTLAEAGIQPVGNYLTTTTSFGGDVSGAYNAIVVANDSHTHAGSNLTGTSLASGIVTSSLTSVGTIGTGVWQGTDIADDYIASASSWNAAHTHISSNGSDHSYINQSVTTSGTPQFSRIGLGAAAASQALLHLAINSTGEVPEGMISLVNAGAGEASIRINNSATGTNSWYLGLNHTADFKLGYNTSTTGFNDSAIILKATTEGAVTATSFNSITGLATTAPSNHGTAAVGTSTLAARQDHVHNSNNTWRGIDDTPVNGQTAESISSNWAYDHANDNDAHHALVTLVTTSYDYLSITGQAITLGQIDASTDISGLATVATTGSYTDLSDKPSIAYSSAIAADDFTQTEVNNLRAAKLDDGTTPWTSNNHYDDTDVESYISGTSPIEFSSGAISLAASGVTANTYSSGISAITVDTYGRITSITGSAGYTTNTGDITGVTAGNGLTGGGTSSSVTLNVASHAGSAGSIGTINIGANAIGVNLGTSSTTAAAGDHTHGDIKTIKAYSNSFGGSGTATTFAHNLGSAPSHVSITPSADPGGYLGEIWYTADGTNINVYNSGAATTTFTAIAYI